jgi:hypothetical protein
MSIPQPFASSFQRERVVELLAEVNAILGSGLLGPWRDARLTKAITRVESVGGLGVTASPGHGVPGAVRTSAAPKLDGCDDFVAGGGGPGRRDLDTKIGEEDVASWIWGFEVGEPWIPVDWKVSGGVEFV